MHNKLTDGMDGYVMEPVEFTLVTLTNVGLMMADGYLPCYIDTGDTAWMLTATSLVLFMSPGVGFFYGGLARSKNITNVLGMTLIVMGLMAVQWVLWGYSLAFGPIDSDANMFMGSLDYAGFNMVSNYAPLGAPTVLVTDTFGQMRIKCNEFKDGEYCSQDWPSTVPHQCLQFQGTFAIITPILIIGGLIDRIKFSALIIFVLLWGTFVYDPIAHWVWGGGFIGGGGIRSRSRNKSQDYALRLCWWYCSTHFFRILCIGRCHDPWQKTRIW